MLYGCWLLCLHSNMSLGGEAEGYTYLALTRLQRNQENHLKKGLPHISMAHCIYIHMQNAVCGMIAVIDSPNGSIQFLC